MKIKYKGQEYEAYSLIMRKENALAILNGEKTIETRQMSAKYEKMFTDPKSLEPNEDGQIIPDLRTDIEVVHFYSTGAKWTLDVAIDEIGIGEMTDEGMKTMHEEYNFHEFDEAFSKMSERQKKTIPLYFYLHIKKVLNHSGLK